MARFDGVRFTIFDKGNTKGILNNRFIGVFLDKDGVIWASTESGAITIYRNGIFTSYQAPETFKLPMVIVRDGAGAAQLQTTDKAYYLRDGKFVEAAESKQLYVKEFYYGKSGAKWTLTAQGISHEKDGRLTHYPLSIEPAAFFYYAQQGMYENAAGSLWFGMKDKLYLIGNGVVSVFTQGQIPALEKSALVAFYEEADGTQWLVFGPATNTPIANAQLVRFKDNQFTSYDLGEPVTIGTGLADREGNVWLSTREGLRRLRRKLISTLSVKDGLNSNEIYPLLQADSGDIFIGSTNGVNRWADGKITDLKLQDQFFPLAAHLRGLWQDKSSNIWLGFLGVNSFGRLETSYRVKRIGKAETVIGATDFAADAEGNIWIATEDGLFKYRDDRQIAHYTAADGLRSGKIITLHFDRHQQLWLGTFDGVSLFKDGKFTNFAEIANSPKGFVRAIYEDADGVLWFGTYGDGLVRYKDGRFFNYRVEHRLFNNGVFAILEDERRNFWMSSNRGIHRVSKQELNDFADGKIPKLNSVAYDEKDGMLNAECNGGRIPAAIKTKDGKLWFATMGGVAIVDPAAERVNPNPPPVVIENISIDRRPVEFHSALELQPGQSNIAIEYTGLSLTKSEQIKFRYQLEGLEANWIEAGTRRTVDYSYLPAGTYTFRVLAANANGVWNNESTSIRIVVHPYFYQTWWFLLLTSLASAATIWLIAHYRLAQVRKISEAKTAFSRQLITSQEAERKRIAAELHDGLGQSLLVIKNRTSLGKRVADDSAKVTAQLDEIAHATSQALEEVRGIAYNLRPYHLERLGLRESIEAMLEKIREATGLTINARVALFDEVFSKDDEVTFYRVIQECLNNIIKHAEATAVEISIVQTETEVTARIQDNGRGFVAAPENQSSGFGLIGMSERVRMLGGTHSIESEASKGTTVTIVMRKNER